LGGPAGGFSGPAGLLGTATRFLRGPCCRRRVAARSSCGAAAAYATNWCHVLVPQKANSLIPIIV
ncbi:hypothetical protein ACLESO_53190, partial [Pyxidicoccus sp. 3LG]